MRIKKIEVHGFKSFADRQVVVVDSKVTGVIGPNGCGKSNIVDAIRWCLGEQSAKHLRGSGMSDVIFAGCSTRGAAGMAEVSITFENEGDVPAPWSNYAELTVSRRLYKDGTSEYLINKVPSRMRDIVQMMMGTGIGSKTGYSIIEQGRVSQIVTSKPEQRRQIIDEAAGITKFKAQKVQAERSMEQTRQNLLRVSDMVTELDGRLGTLRKQAQKAERFVRYRREAVDLELWTASHRYLELSASVRVLTLRANDLNAEVAALRNQSTALDARHAAQRLALAVAQQEFDAQRERQYQIDNDVRMLESERTHKLREAENTQRAADHSQAEIESGGRALASYDAEIERIVEELRGLGWQGQAIHTAGDALAGAQGQVRELEQAFSELDRQLKDRDRDTQNLARERSECMSRAASLEARAQSRVEQASALQEQLDNLANVAEGLKTALEDEQRALEEATLAASSATEQVGTLKEQRAALELERAQLKERLKKVDVEVESARRELLRTTSRKESLEEIAARYEGCASGVQVVMEHRAELAAVEFGAHAGAAPAVHGIMADFISVPQRYEAAMSAVLGDRLQGVVVEGPRSAVGAVDLLKQRNEGRTTFLPRVGRHGLPSASAARTEGAHLGGAIGWSVPQAAELGRSGRIEVVDLSAGSAHVAGTAPGADEAASPDSTFGREDGAAQAPAPAQGESVAVGDAPASLPGVVGRLVDLVDTDARFAPLVRELIGETLVVESLSGALELWQSMGQAQPIVTLEGDRIEASGVVIGGSADALDSALLQNKREIKELSTLAGQLKESLDSALAKQQGFAERLRELDGEKEQIEKDFVQRESERAVANQRVNTTQQAVARIGRELAQQDQRAAQLQAQVASRREEATGLATELEQTRAREPQIEAALVGAREDVERLRGERDQAQSVLGNARVELAKQQQQIAALVASHQRVNAQASGERERIRRLQAVVEESRATIAALQEAVVGIVARHNELLGEADVVRRNVVERQEALSAAQVQDEELALALRNIRKTLEAQRDAANEVEMGLQELRLEQEHLVQDVRERYDLELVEALIDHHARPRATEIERTRLAELRQIIARMGDVNLGAITEYEEVARRFEFLSAQKNDLEQALEQLTAAIETINATTRERFRETFDKVNEMFKQVFPRLFAGGSAELVLSDPNNLLDTGVEIYAQPPGKKVSSLELLSGGEKALTAVSLVFGIFLMKPSPFCLLDEVDAPLDEANVGRFCDLVRELSDRTQFILITHNKRTMEVADLLYGVTMQQRGVSKLVSVNMRRATDAAQYAS